MTCEESKKWLGAHLDGELDLTTDTAVRDHLATCSECRQELTALQVLRQSAAKVPAFEPSDALRARIAQQLPKRKAPRFRLDWIPAFGLGVLATCFVGFLFSARTDQGSSLEAELVASHSRSLLGNHLLDVPSSSRHTVKPWFIGKVDTAPTPWDLKDKGFPLLGGRLDYIGGRPTEVFVYGRRKHFINLFVLESGEAKGWSSSIRGFQAVTWDQDGLFFVAISDIDRPDLQLFSEAFRQAKP